MFYEVGVGQILLFNPQKSSRPERNTDVIPTLNIFKRSWRDSSQMEKIFPICIANAALVPRI
jgi:hypothetical protein